MVKAVKGKTDLWTTRPDIASLLVNPDEGYEVSENSHKKTDFICPDCNTVNHDRIIRNVTKLGFNCHYCSDGISYPERFVSCLFNYLKVDFKRDTPLDWSGIKRYDFYIEEKSLIVETHGSQHYYEHATFNNRDVESEKKNDEIKRKMAIENGILNYIELDCRISEFNYIKNSILNSDLVNIYDLSAINWKQLQVDSLKSKVIEACELYNSGIKSTIKIANLLKIDVSTVIDYLKRCADINLCDYTPDKRKKIICVDTGKVYNSLKSVGADGFSMSQVSECCHGKSNTSGGYNWCFYDEYDEEKYVMKPLPKNISRKVLCIETGKVYDNMTLVSDAGFDRSCVSMVCNGKLKTHLGYHFKYVQ